MIHGLNTPESQYKADQTQHYQNNCPNTTLLSVSCTMTSQQHGRRWGLGIQGVEVEDGLLHGLVGGVHPGGVGPRQSLAEGGG